MSNPVTAVFPLSSNLNGTGQSGSLSLTGVQPIRYDGGLWLEESGSNIVTNPVAGTNTTGWAVSGFGSIAQTASLPGPLPDWLASAVTTGVEWTATVDRTATGSILGVAATAASAVKHSAQFYLWVPSAYSGTGLRLVAYNFTGGAVTVEDQVDMGLRDQWQLLSGAVTPNASDLVGNLFVEHRSGTILSGEKLWMTLASVGPENYATSPVAGSIGAGYSWSGTAHASTSTRAASSASISPSGIIDTYLGAIVFRATPTVETGAEEIWGELGEKGAGTDHIRWGRDATKHPYVEWSGNDSAYTRITLTPTVDAGDEHFYSIEWHVGDADFRLYLDDNPSDNDTIPSPQEDYGAGTLKLEATAGGVIYNGLMICNERLTNAQRARLQDVGHWSVRTLERLRVEVARPQFELRPY